MNRWNLVAFMAVAALASAAGGANSSSPWADGLRRAADEAVRDAQRQADAWMADPFRHLADRMAAVESSLGQPRTGKDVQQQEQEILGKLDRIIAELSKACSGGTGMSQNPTHPAGDSVLRKGENRMGELHAPGQSGRKWAEVPPKEREKILQSTTQGFPPGYESLLEDYFRRLATEQAPEAATIPAPAGPKE